MSAYEGTKSKKIHEVITCALDIDGRRLPKQTMIVLDMDHQIILGRKWLSKQDVLPDCKRRKLIWPEERQDYIAARELDIPQEALERQEIDLKHQQDADRRDKAIRKDTTPWRLSRILQRDT